MSPILTEMIGYNSLPLNPEEDSDDIAYRKKMNNYDSDSDSQDMPKLAKHNTEHTVSNKPKIKLFSKVRLNNETFEVGDLAKFKENEFSSLVGKILKIMDKSANGNFPCVQVQWYYKKKDINFDSLKITTNDQIFVGDNEVFPSNHKDTVALESILCKVKVS